MALRTRSTLSRSRRPRCSMRRALSAYSASQALSTCEGWAHRCSSCAFAVITSAWSAARAATVYIRSREQTDLGSRPAASNLPSQVCPISLNWSVRPSPIREMSAARSRPIVLLAIGQTTSRPNRPWSEVIAVAILRRASQSAAVARSPFLTCTSICWPPFNSKVISSPAPPVSARIAVTRS